ncbi:PSP1 domain-containing protein [Streptococcus loxodontisalivarius]|uniref:Cell fate regulator YaaT (PSP1 superfamily) n=1 Tax=Streptococcus loxodontisalivarius TaxID=1349415 RepID=A0ABS2PUX4_9STRE|nr:stage 0 sporulation family protein [Streptococcus loxodontisalivarius]MBM7643510.1 cell fate regulator YaaT (PSP1 superfamily) [Streptococcus loxodontisalivarius]
MTEVIGVRYADDKDLVYVEATGNYQKDDLVVIAQKKGNRLAKVVLERRNLEASKLPAEMNAILRKASNKDVQAFSANEQLAKDSYAKVRQLINQNGLEMKVVSIQFPLDRQHVLISFTADKRVDFRQLLKDLAGLFKTRIELRQISSREEAKVYGGLGPCGRPLCCSTFLGDFPPVSIKMLKNQHLSLNSGKYNGLCGRLMCCLSFEDDFYREAKERFPDYGSQVRTQEGEGQVIGFDVFAETIRVSLNQGHRQLTYALEEIEYG